jgi:predicted transcriptional regulator
MRHIASPPHTEVTTTLPAALYEQLQQEAQRRRVSLAAILREALEAYVQSPKQAD